MARKGQFKKGGGRVGGDGGKATRKRRAPSKAIVVVGATAPRRRRAAPRHVAASHQSHPVHVRRRKSHRKGRIIGGSPMGYALMAGGMAYIDAQGTGDDKGIAGSVNKALDKLPGAKTLGRPAVAGLALGALEHFTSVGGRLRPYMRIAGTIGVILAASKVGAAGTAFKWLGDADERERQPPIQRWAPSARQDVFSVEER